jgi:acyl carrier protein
MQNIEQELRQFVTDNFLFGQAACRLSSHDSFLDQGIIDSTGVLELVAFLEEKYRIKIEDHELTPEYLDSIHKLMKFLERKLQSSQ